MGGGGLKTFESCYEGKAGHYCLFLLPSTPPEAGKWGSGWKREGSKY